VRERYRGPLVFARQLVGVVRQDPLLVALDYIGVRLLPSARLPIPRFSNCGGQPAPWPMILSLLHQATGKPVIFTEIGYKSVRGTSVKPAEKMLAKGYRRPPPHL